MNNEEKYMKIQKILSNNAIVIENSQGELLVALGKGIGFGKKIGDVADANAFEAQFLQQDTNIERYYQQLFNNIPDDIIQVSRKIVALVENEATILSPLSLLLALSDHLYFAISRISDNLPLKSPLAWDLQVFYAKEYQLAIDAVHLINSSLNVNLSEDEAGFLALHIISSKQNANIQDTMNSAELVKDILNIIKISLKITLNENSLEFQRIVTHLKFFSLRMISREPVTIGDDSIYTGIKEKLPIAYRCAEKIQYWLITNHTYTMTLDELIFLTIHIDRLRDNN